MKKLLQITALSLLLSCQIEDKNAPLPADSFIKYYGVLAEQEAKDLEPIVTNGEITGFVILGTQTVEDGTKDYYVAKTDLEGNLVTSNTFGLKRLFRELNFVNQNDSTSTEDAAARIETIPGGYLVVGTSSFSQTAPGVNIVDLSFITYAFLDENLQLAATDSVVYQFGTVNVTPPNNIQRDLIGNDIIALSDGNYLLVGAIEALSFPTDPTSTETDLNFFIRKFNRSGTIWERSIYGLKGGLDDVLVRAFELSNGNIALFGYNEQVGSNGEGGTNVAFREINQNGNIVNSSSIGIPEEDPTFALSDVLSNVIVRPGGYLAVGTTTNTNDETFAFFMNIDDNGISLWKKTLVSAFTSGGVPLQTRGLGATATRTNDFVIVGNYPSFRTDVESINGVASRGQEAMFMRVSQTGEEMEGFETNYGLGDGNDTAVDAITMPDGKIMIAATIDFGGGVKMISLIKLNDTGRLDR